MRGQDWESVRKREFRISPRGGRFGKPRGSPDGGRGLVSVVQSSECDSMNVENRRFSRASLRADSCPAAKLDSVYLKNETSRLFCCTRFRTTPCLRPYYQYSFLRRDKILYIRDNSGSAECYGGPNSRRVGF